MDSPDDFDDEDDIPDETYNGVEEFERIKTKMQSRSVVSPPHDSGYENSPG